MNITDLTVHELQEKLSNKEITSEEIVKAYIENIEEKDAEVQAFITKVEEDAINEAKNIDKKEKMKKFQRIL